MAPNTRSRGPADPEHDQNDQTQTSTDDATKIQSLEDLLLDKEEEIQTLKDTIAELSVLKGIRRETKPDKETIQTSIERDPSEPPLRHSATASRRSSSVRFSAIPEENSDADPDSDNEDSLHKKGRLSAKHPDPPLFHNQEKKDDLPFEAWFDRVQDKLEANDDHFPTSRAKMLYVKGRLAGSAATDLMPYFESTHIDQITTYKEMMTHLWREYSDPNREEKAMTDFTNLKMRDTDRFDWFKNKFVRLAGQCQRPKQDWKREMYQRLPFEYKKQIGAQHRDPSISFQQFCINLSNFGHVLRQAAAEAKAARGSSNSNSNSNSGNGNRNSNRNSNTGGGGSSSSSSSRTPAAANNKTAAERAAETQKLVEEGRCFGCKERGHTKRDCPEKEKYEREKRDRVAAIVARQLAYEDSKTAASTDKSAEESEEKDKSEN